MHPLDGVMKPRAFAVFDTLAPLATQHGFYLIGGTALATHLHHRMSTDLDFFLHVDFTPDDVEREILDCGMSYVVTSNEANTVNLVCEGVPVQFLADPSQRQVEDPTRMGPALVAGVADICAMKLKVLLDRAKLRDYYDLMVIETVAPIPIEHGLQLVVERFDPTVPEQTLSEIVRALGYLGDVEDDPTVPIDRSELEAFWARRQPEIVEHLTRSAPQGPFLLGGEAREKFRDL